MHIGIVGSRRRNSKEDEKYVFDLVSKYLDEVGHANLVLVSGGCALGADAFAERAADYFGVSILVHYPIRLPKVKSRYEAAERNFARNRKIAQDSDILFAFIAPDRTGGTENTIKHAKELGKKIVLIFPDGSYHPLNYSSSEGE
jgi:predicted Rossmann fold nucleotide-binding protein DprA/Smf involved in DNA uptake